MGATAGVVWRGRNGYSQVAERVSKCGLGRCWTCLREFAREESVSRERERKKGGRVVLGRRRGRLERRVLKGAWFGWLLGSGTTDRGRGPRVVEVVGLWTVGGGGRRGRGGFSPEQVRVEDEEKGQPRRADEKLPRACVVSRGCRWLEGTVGLSRSPHPLRTHRTRVFSALASHAWLAGTKPRKHAYSRASTRSPHPAQRRRRLSFHPPPTSPSFAPSLPHKVPGALKGTVGCVTSEGWVAGGAIVVKAGGLAAPASISPRVIPPPWSRKQLSPSLPTTSPPAALQTRRHVRRAPVTLQEEEEGQGREGEARVHRPLRDRPRAP